HQYVRNRKPCFFVNPSFGFIKNLPLDGYIVHDNENQLGAAIIKGQGPGMQLVMHMCGGGRGSEPTHYTLSQFWGYVASRSTRTELPYSCSSVICLRKQIYACKK